MKQLTFSKPMHLHFENPILYSTHTKQYYPVCTLENVVGAPFSRNRQIDRWKDKLMEGRKEKLARLGTYTTLEDEDIYRIWVQKGG
jgi:hypothetical protein